MYASIRMGFANCSDVEVSQCPHRRHPREGVMSREIDKGFVGRFPAEASQSRSVVGVNEFFNECITFLVGEEFVFASIGSDGGLGANGVGHAPVEALNHTVGLRAKRFDEAMFDAVIGTDSVEGMPAGCF